MNLTLRRANRSDIAAIEAVCVAAFSEYAAHSPKTIFEGYLEELRRLADYWEESEAYVVEENGRILGSALFYPDISSEGLPLGWAGIRKLAVLPEARGRRIAQRLVKACLKAASDRGADVLALHTASFAAPAVALYEGLGFRRCGEYDLLIPDPEGQGELRLLAYRIDITSD
ncbi:GNAT family N-acetyltransferase [Lacibacterium aquatile]|uniref:GNAT family N-acetyltransferase n=1 Tax=Lacibacterium aquatile TaxID=1168082 RepID=A0ABW5DVX3_9PROT